MAIDKLQSATNTHLLSSLFIGVPSIDKEHGELVAQLDLLASHPDTLPNSENFSEMLSQLGGQINTHFTNEESIFKSLGMSESEISNHVQAHTDILDQYTQLNIDLMQGKAFSHSDVLIMIKGWIVGHIVCFDLNIKKYLPKLNEAASERTNLINI